MCAYNHSSQRYKIPAEKTQCHLKIQFPPGMTSLKSQQNFQTCLNQIYWSLSSRIYTSKGFQDDWRQNNNRQTFTDRHLLIPVN